jgi:hypothetical protein
LTSRRAPGTFRALKPSLLPAPIRRDTFSPIGRTADHEDQMLHRPGFAIAALLLAALPLTPAHGAQDDSINVELNSVEGVQTKCRMAFVIDNKDEVALETLKLDLAVFNRDGVVQRRLVIEMGPVRRAKTMVRTFEIDGDCGQIGSILVNDVTACAPGEPGACLDRLTLTSRVSGIRLYK